MVPQLTVIDHTKNDVPRDFVRNIAEHFFSYLSDKKILPNDIPCSLTIVFVTIEEITRYNKIYRNKSVPTDVLSFCAMDGDHELNESVIGSGESVGYGDVLICKEVVKQNAIRYKVSQEEELSRVIVHGILHLIGYEHSGVVGESKEKMIQLQEDFIDNLKARGFIK